MRTRTTDGWQPLAGEGAVAAALRLWATWRARRVAAVSWDAGRDATATFRPGADGLVLACRSGTFLVTQEGDPADHVLEPGDAFEAGPRGRVAVWALHPGALRVRRAAGRR